MKYLRFKLLTWHSKSILFSQFKFFCFSFHQCSLTSPHLIYCISLVFLFHCMKDKISPFFQEKVIQHNFFSVTFFFVSSHKIISIYIQKNLKLKWKRRQPSKIDHYYHLISYGERFQNFRILRFQNLKIFKFQNFKIVNFPSKGREPYMGVQNAFFPDIAPAWEDWNHRHEDFKNVKLQFRRWDMK